MKRISKDRKKWMKLKERIEKGLKINKKRNVINGNKYQM